MLTTVDLKKLDRKFLSLLPVSNSVCALLLCGNTEGHSNFDLQYSAERLLFSVQFSSVAQMCPTLCDPMNHSMPGLPVHHQLQECTQTHVHQVDNTIQPSHPLLSPSPPGPKAALQIEL